MRHFRRRVPGRRGPWIVANSRFRCSQCKQYGEVDSVFRTAGLARLCSTECYSQYLDEQRAKRKRNTERKTKATKAAKRAASPKIPGEVRFYVRERDKVCRWCGCEGTQVHHVVYRSQGGPDTPDNLILLCSACHGRAHSSKDAYAAILLEYVRRAEAGERTLFIPEIARQLMRQGSLTDLQLERFGIAS